MCAARAKPEFPPLLAPGLHSLTVDGLRALCVDAFPNSRSRAGIMNNLCTVIARLQADGVSGALWVNGSFLTAKINPDDVDVVLRMEGILYDSGTQETRDAVDWLNDNLYATHKVDSYVFYVWPAGHAMRWLGEYADLYWQKQFGQSRRAIPKGIAELKLSGSVP